MKHYALAGLLTLLIQPAAAAALPEGAIKEGTLSNQQLIQDAMTGVAAEVATRGCGSPEDFIPYVMTMPEGSVGSRHWRELWVVKGCGKEFPVEMNFREAGSGAANWSIK